MSRIRSLKSLFAVAAFSCVFAACGDDDEPPVGLIDSGVNEAADGGDAAVSLIDAGADAGVDSGVDSGLDAGVDAGGPFSCDNFTPTVGTSSSACQDFNDDVTPSTWANEAGDWSVVDGAYRGVGPAVSSTCADSDISASTYLPILASDVHMLARMRATGRPDKALILRWGSIRDRIELNFRGSYSPTNPGDVIVQERVACVTSTRTAPNEINVPHSIGEYIDVEVFLEGDRLRIIADGQMVLDRVFAGISQRVGRAGVGVIARNTITATATFDQVIIESLDP